MTWDKTLPLGTESKSLGDDRIRETRADIETALTFEGTFPGAVPATPIFTYTPPSGNIAARPATNLHTGRLYINTENGYIERYSGGAWNPLYLPATAKLYFDGGGDTYLYESAANIVNFYAGGNNIFRLDETNSLVSVQGTTALAIPATQRLYLDGGGNTYIYEGVADVISFFAGNDWLFKLDEPSNLVAVLGSNDFAIPTGRKIYLDGGGDTYIYEYAANQFGIVVGGDVQMTFNKAGSEVIVNNGFAGTVNGAMTIYAKTANDYGLYLSGSWSGKSNPILHAELTDATYAGSLFYGRCTRASSSAFDLMYLVSAADLNFRLNGNGDGTCDGSWTGGGADYAELFESVDGNSISVGTSVVLNGDKVRPAQEGEEPIGAVSARSTVVGNEKINWQGKYQTDEFGCYVLDEKGDRIPNPGYDSTMVYKERGKRPEWIQVGLMGQIPVAKGQPIGSRWIKMGKSNSKADWYLVR